MSVIPNRCSQTRHFSMELRPRKLKDCLLEDSNSCSSSGFRSFPRHPQKPNLVKHPQAETEGLSKKRSRTLQAVINAVKRFHLTTVKSPAIISRSLSRRLGLKKDSSFFFSRREKVTETNKIIIRVKDIVRWRSSRDLIEEKSWPLDTEPSPPRQQTTTTTTTTSNSTPRSSNCSSWCDSDFTSEFLPSWGINCEENGENENGGSKKDLPSVGGDCTETPTAVEADKEVGREDLPCDGENEYYSPLCVLDVQSEHEEDDEESISSFSQSFANMERTKQRLMQKIKRFECLAKIEPVNLHNEWTQEEEDPYIESQAVDASEDEELGEDVVEIEEKEKQLWNQIKASCTNWSNKEQSSQEPLIMDFFRDELARSHHETYRYQEFENGLVARANAWMCDVEGSGIEWGSLEQKREDCVKDMERATGKWEGFSEEQKEVAMEIENELVSTLLDEMLDDAYFN